jgi:hypothetical protein
MLIEASAHWARAACNTKKTVVVFKALLAPLRSNENPPVICWSRALEYEIFREVSVCYLPSPGTPLPLSALMGHYALCEFNLLGYPAAQKKMYE